MGKLDKIINEIDTSKMETKFVDLMPLSEGEFEIYEWLEQPSDNVRLTYCYYYRWICTDTEVGIRVWYFDNKPVCVSWQPYRKSGEEFGWISEEDYNNVKKYLHSLRSDGLQNEVDIIDDSIISSVIDAFEKIDYKKHEKKNVK